MVSITILTKSKQTDKVAISKTGHSHNNTRTLLKDRRVKTATKCHMPWKHRETTKRFFLANIKGHNQKERVLNMLKLQ